MADIKFTEYSTQFYKQFLIFGVLIFTYFMIEESIGIHFHLLASIAIKGSISLLLFFGLLWIIDGKKVREFRDSFCAALNIKST